MRLLLKVPDGARTTIAPGTSRQLSRLPAKIVRLKLRELGSEGQYYTQAEIRNFLAYARDRGIHVLPEFDMPGHSRSWMAGYPELASRPGSYRAGRIADADTVMDPTRDGTYKSSTSSSGK